MPATHTAAEQLFFVPNPRILSGDGTESIAEIATEPEPHAALWNTPIRALMTSNVICVRSDLSVEAARELFLLHGIGCAPVVDHQSHPIGVVSKTDLVRDVLAGEGDSSEVQLGWSTVEGYAIEMEPGFHAETLPKATVGEIMTPHPLTLQDSAPVGQAAGLMATKGVHHLLVAGSSGRLRGILSSADIVHWVAVEAGTLPRSVVKPGARVRPKA